MDGGRTWTKVLYENENIGGLDVVIDPSSPNVVYATMWESRLGPWEDDNSYEGTPVACSNRRMAAPLGIA